jgi:hypothetical protein
MTKKIVAVDVNWDLQTANVIEQVKILKDLGIYIVNEDGSEELDVWVESKIYKEVMISEVKEFFKHPILTANQFVMKPANAYSSRYKDKKMVMDCTSYIKPIFNENGIVKEFLISKNDENYHLEDDLTKEILDIVTIDNEHPISYEPKRYEKKIKGCLELFIENDGTIDQDRSVFTEWFPMYAFFKRTTNIMNLMALDMINRS